MALAELPTIIALEAFETVEIAARLFRTERIDRKDEPVALVARDLLLAQLLAHAPSSIFQPIITTFGRRDASRKHPAGAMTTPPAGAGHSQGREAPPN